MTPGEDLGAGDDDAGARAHPPQLGQLRRVQLARPAPPAVIS